MRPSGARRRLVIEVVTAVRERIGDAVLGVRIGTDDHLEGRFGVVWQRVADGREEIVLSALLPPGGPAADEIILSEGRFLGLEAQDGRATLLVLQDDGRLEAQWIVFSAAIHRPPIDILRSEVFILDQLEGTLRQTLPSVHRGLVNTLLAWWPTRHIKSRLPM